MKYYLAIDLGATSGRHVIGYLDKGEIKLEEIHRFKTEMDDSNDGLVWDIPRIFNEIKIGIKKAFSKYSIYLLIVLSLNDIFFSVLNLFCKLYGFVKEPI